jgi:hypothetical protein
MGGEQFSLKDAIWNFANDQIKEHTAQASTSDDGLSLTLLINVSLICVFSNTTGFD